MKLKKIASLALAGVMAVSMLAGCSVKPGTSTDDNGTTVVTGSSNAFVNAFNNDVEYENEGVKLTFKYSSALESELKSVLTDNGDVGSVLTDPAVLLGEMKLRNGIDVYEDGVSEFEAKDKETVTYQNMAVYSSDQKLSEKALLKEAVGDLETVVADLKANTKPENADEGTEYVDYTYTADIAVVDVEQISGVTYTFVVYTISQTGTKATYEL